MGFGNYDEFARVLWLHRTKIQQLQFEWIYKLMAKLTLKHDLIFTDLYKIEGLAKLDKKFCQWLANIEPQLYQELMLARAQIPKKLDESKLIISLGPWLEIFITDLFNVSNELHELAVKQQELAPISTCKRLFVQRKVAKNFTHEELEGLPSAIEKLQNFGVDIEDELSFARHVMQWLVNSDSEKLAAARIYTGWALFTEAGKEKHRDSVLFNLPQKIDVDNLLKLEKQEDGKLYAKHTHLRAGFHIQKDQFQPKHALDNSHYCIYCHNQSKDSCAHGLPNKAEGCPLEEHISEMNYLKSQAHPLAALAVAMINNPLLAATGHRICNDCMKSCIYQKQEPVNIPMIESSVLQDILELPWGFEIYSLLTRWNPLNLTGYLPSPLKDHKILVVGQGPAGFTLAYYLLQQGYSVVGIDGLKIEPLPAELSGVDMNGLRHAFVPINKLDQLYNSNDPYEADGFGGVAEYGITVRWNKNYLKIIRLLLERRSNFRLYGGIRFGSNITYENAKELGFDHIALAVGAGSPNLPQIPNIMAKGVRTASDFLMSLQLSNVTKIDSVANLQLRLPAVIIGGGLTAVDTATEILAYYPLQVEKFYKLANKAGEEFWQSLTEEERQIAEEFINHACQLQTCKTDAEKLALLKKWGGVTVAYRGQLTKAPSYRLNHEELNKAFAEGIMMLAEVEPLEILIDEFGSCRALRYKGGELAARAILIAAGTNPNTVLAREFPEILSIDAKTSYFKFHSNFLVNNQLHPAISCFGDAHPKFSGNVVKAMASAKNGYQELSELLQKNKAVMPVQAAEFFASLNKKLLSFVHAVNRLSSDIVEVIIHSPLAAANFAPGQFYRLQNFRQSSAGLMEGIALTGSWVDKDKGLVSLIILEMGGSSNLCAKLQEGEPVCLMGPTGTPTLIPHDKTVILVGGGLGNAVLFSIGKALRANGCQVIYFAGYKKAQDCYKKEAIEAAADIVIWCCERDLLIKNRPQDLVFKGNVVQAMLAYTKGEMGEVNIPLSKAEHLVVIGSDRMMYAVQKARYAELAQYLHPKHSMIASINSPMQCMMKEICGQCLQRHVDPNTGQESYVYSCFNQDQVSDYVDYKCLHLRLSQNSLLEKISNL
jgi:NADPH-dependent glutamate synthase beta subunit-like oxidoreductase/NAD(P)H-flavin reductase